MQILHHATGHQWPRPGALVLAFVLGRMPKKNLRKSLILSRGDLKTFIERPISLRKKRELVALDEGA